MLENDKDLYVTVPVESIPRLDQIRMFDADFGARTFRKLEPCAIQRHQILDALIKMGRDSI